MTSFGIPEAVCPSTTHKAWCTAPLHRLAEVVLSAPWLLPVHYQHLLQKKGETKTFQNSLSLNCSAEPLRKNTAKAGSTFPPPELHSPSNPSFQDMTAPALHFNVHFILSHSVGWHSPHSGWGLVWLSRCFPCPFTTILSHPMTSKFFLGFPTKFPWSAVPTGFHYWYRDVVEVQTPKSHSTVKNDTLHKTSIINQGSPWTSASECIQSGQASILFWNHNLLGSLEFFFPLKAKYFKMKPVALFPLQNETNKWNFSVGKKVTNKSN